MDGSRRAIRTGEATHLGIHTPPPDMSANTRLLVVLGPSFRSRAVRTTAIVLALAAPTLGAQRATAAEGAISAPVTAMRYEVTADKVALAARRLSVTTSFDVADGGVVLLSLPAWTPGAYEITNFAKWVSGFRATQDGAALRWDKLDYDTWRVRPTRAGRVSVSFEYAADTLDNAMSWTRPDFALFNGTNLFMYPEAVSYTHL